MYARLWDAMPQAYVQLLLRANVDEVHAFAYDNLRHHPDQAAIEARMDLELIGQLLASAHKIPVRWGLSLVRQRLTDHLDPALLRVLLGSHDYEARKLARDWMGKRLQTILADSSLTTELLFSPHGDLRHWVRLLLTQQPTTPDQRQLLVGRALLTLATLTEPTDNTNRCLREATEFLLGFVPELLATLNPAHLTDLLGHPLEAAQVFAVRVLISQQTTPTAPVLAALLLSPFAAVRQAGADLLAAQDGRLATDPFFAPNLAVALLPGLIRREPAEGLHDQLAAWLRGPLASGLAALDRAAVLRLLYAAFRPAQELGLLVLTTHPHELTLRQVIALGNHELHAVRRWCWHYFRRHPDRIRQQREEAIRLLDATWDDTRAAAMAFFREVFTEDDWTPETLVALADSVRPDVQAFGRELITRFFTDDHGPDYLLTLSQHPSAAVQLFTTNYLQRFAANHPERLRSLAFYFRAVLLRPHRNRTAKNRIFAFLHAEGLRTEENARFVAQLLADMSGTSAIGDKARCIAILRDLSERFPAVETPLLTPQPLSS